MASNAVRTLRHVRDRHGDQLLHFGGNGPVSEDARAEGAERLGRSRSETSALLGYFAARLREEVFVFGHFGSFPRECLRLTELRSTLIQPRLSRTPHPFASRNTRAMLPSLPLHRPMIGSPQHHRGKPPWG